MTEQEKREKVIESLKFAIEVLNTIIPFQSIEERNDINTAIDLLKAQEPRAMTLEEVIARSRKDETVFVDCNKTTYSEVAFVGNVDKDSEYGHIYFRGQFNSFSKRIADYGKTWRCLTHYPADEQRKATLWNSIGNK